MAKKQLPRIEPEEEESLVKSLGRKALAPLAMVGNILDVPGSMVRDVLGGNNPLDQLATPTTDANRITGRELLRKRGLADERDTTSNFMAGLGADIALDPLTYLTLGAKSALTGGGRALRAVGGIEDLAQSASRAAGRTIGPREALTSMSLNEALANVPSRKLNEYLPKLDRYARTQGMQDVAELLRSHGNQPLAGGFTVGVPFGEKHVIGAGSDITKSVAKGMDKALEGAAYGRYSAPVRAFRQYFDSRVGGKYLPHEQKAEMLKYGLDRSSMVKAKGATWDLLNDLDKVQHEWVNTFGHVQHGGRDMPAETAALIEDTMRYADEVKADANTMQEVFNKKAPGRTVTPELTTKMLDAIASTHAHRDAIRDLIELKGGSDAHVGSDWFQHAPRYTTRDTEPFLGDSFKTFPMKGQSTVSRNPVLRPLPETIANEAVFDPILRAAPAGPVDPITNRATYTPNQLDSAVQKYGKWWDPNKLAELNNPATLPAQKQAILDEFRQNAQDLMEHSAEYSQKFVDKVASGQLKLFGNHYSDDVAKYLKQMHKINASYDAIHELFRTNVLGSGSVNLNGSTMNGNLRKAFEAAGVHDADRAMEYFAKQVMNMSLQDAENLVVHPDAIKAASGWTKIVQQPEWANTLGSFVDNFNKMFKEHVTYLFPAFHGRNFTSGQWMNLASGEVENLNDLMAYKDWFMKTRDMAHNPQAVTDPFVADKMRQMYEHGVLNWGFDPDMEVAGKFLEKKRRGSLQPGNPFDIKSSLQEASHDVSKTPLEAFGHNLGAPEPVRKGRVGHQTALVTGRKMNEQVEFMNRATMYNYLTEYKGMAPEVAAKRVWELHTDWSSLTPFEKDVMRRVVPFWSFTRHMLPEVIKNITTHPGGLTANMLKITNRMRGSDATTPEYVAGSTSIPFGETDDGGHRYLTGMGLAHEDPISLMGPIGGDLQGGLLEALSRTTPLIKAPLEWATGESFFQRGPGGGRDIEDLDPLLGRIGANITGQEQAYKLPRELEFMVANSPLTRVLSTVRTLTDPRKEPITKALNLSTGMRFTDISPAAEDAILRENAQREMKSLGSKTFLRTYIPDPIEASMSPEVKEQARRLEALMNELATRAKERKAAKAAKEAGQSSAK